ncbi:MAG: hypothetical protein R2797_12910 [Gelidibacter sp.]
MKTTKHILTAALTLILLASCSSDDDGGSTPMQTLLTKIVTNSQTTTYTYDNNNRATGFSSVYSNPLNDYAATYTYNSSGQLSEAFYDVQSPSDDFKSVYFYNVSGQVTKIETYLVVDGVETYDSKSEADYSVPGKVSVYQTYAGNAPYLSVEYYLDANGNTTSQLSYDTNGLLIVTTENSDFDDKHISSLSVPNTGFVRNVNNYRTVTVTPTGGTPNVGTFTYEYNNDDYPTKRTSNTGSVVTYEYIKR